MKVTIITVSLNSADTISDCIRSVIGQTYREIEHISIDGGSIDGTREIIEGFGGRFAARLSEADGGIYQAMNKGLSLAGGELIGFLHSDDIFAGADVLDRVVDCLDGGGLDSCYGDLVYVSARDPRKIVRHWISGPFDAAKFERGWMPPHPAFFVRKSVYDRFGVFNPAFPVVADYEIMLRFLYRHRISSGYLPRVVIRKRTGGISRPTPLNILRNNAACYQAWIANGLRPRPGIFIRKIISKIRQF